MDPIQLMKITLRYDQERGYIPKKNYLYDFFFHNPQFCDMKHSESKATPGHQKVLYTPITPFKKRVKYEIDEFPVLLDSTDMNHKDWISIAKKIRDSYEKYDAFIVLHGTDTIAYTAAALSFMLENLKKTVIITAAMIPLYEGRNDAANNIMSSLIIAGHYWIPEVLVVFNNRVYRGNRILKDSNHDIDAIKSPNYPPIGTFV